MYGFAFCSTKFLIGSMTLEGKGLKKAHQIDLAIPKGQVAH